MILAGGRSLQCSAFQGWSPGTRIDSLSLDRTNYKLVHNEQKPGFLKKPGF